MNHDHARAQPHEQRPVPAGPAAHQAAVFGDRAAAVHGRGQSRTSATTPPATAQARATRPPSTSTPSTSPRRTRPTPSCRHLHRPHHHGHRHHQLLQLGQEGLGGRHHHHSPGRHRLPGERPAPGPDLPGQHPGAGPATSSPAPTPPPCPSWTNATTPPSTTYNGNSGIISLTVSPSVTVATNIPGDTLFFGGPAARAPTPTSWPRRPTWPRPSPPTTPPASRPPTTTSRPSAPGSTSRGRSWASRRTGSPPSRTA